MSIVRALNAVGTVLACAVGAAGDAVPAADPSAVHDLLVEIGLMSAVTTGDALSDAELGRALRRFQARVGLVTDGVAGPRTVHLLTRYASEARDLREFGLAA
jgi:murein L,D-transpeptidase YcbB/YkuD